MNRPLLRSRGAAMHTLRATVPPVGGIIRRHGFDRPDVLWLSASRFSFPMLSMVQAAKKAYRMSDDWAAFPEVPRALIDLEAKILDTVDAVFVTGRSLEERVRARRPDVVYLPNGVDDVFFRGRTSDDPAVASYPRPRVVFAGTLGDWVDFDAIAAAARRSPQASFLLVGAGRAAEKRAFPANVYRVGAVAYEQLPAVIAACHVGIVPFRRTPRTEAASSNKVLQYLACGLPVVCSRTKEIEQAGAPVAICDHAEQFAEAVADALQHGDEHRAARSDFARRHTWKQRADVVRATLGF
jgi:glycosyltransferase involved in cell wall biosynthesis